MKRIQFFFESPTSVLKSRNKLRSFLLKMMKEHKKEVECINIIFCDDPYLLSINKSFLGHDYFTDIITFDLSDKTQSLLQAEIYISIDRVKENAALHQSTYQKELHRVLFHGFLHLAGFKDKSKQQKSIMREEENKLLSKYFSSK